MEFDFTDHSFFFLNGDWILKTSVQTFHLLFLVTDILTVRKTVTIIQKDVGE